MTTPPKATLANLNLLIIPVKAVYKPVCKLALWEPLASIIMMLLLVAFMFKKTQISCAQNGCAARLACQKSPLGVYFAEQHQYHMAIFACQI